VEAELGKRYGADYQVVVAGSAREALEALGELRDGQGQVSLVLVGLRLQDATGTELLARVREFYPAARRVLLITWGDQASMKAVAEATVLGDLDAYVVRPGTPPDEVFHRSVTEQLGEWGRSNLPGIDVVRVVGEEWAARSHELRELLGRNGVPFSFYPADSPEGQRLLEQGSGKALPTVVMFDGRVLADPSNAEVAEALGVSTKPGSGRYDVTVIGAGPAGLAAAVYGASEGLSTVVVEPEAIGGQAGTSSLIRNYLVLIGAEPRTQWLPGIVRRDQSGFVVTGTDLLEDGRPAGDWPLRRLPMFLESSLPGVFAVGDVRYGSVKRVASAVGEGSIAIRLVHDYLRST
jgi:thioredoxin reductase (NADPH)